MANPTTNYGFVLPTATDLVTDLPADFDVALQGVDTRLKALQPGTTLGDLAYSSATANTNTRLAIGTTGQVLAVSGGVPAWTTTAASGMTLIARTSFSNVASQAFDSVFTSTYKNYLVVMDDISAATATDDLLFNFRYSGTTESTTYYGNAVISEYNSSSVTNFPTNSGTSFKISTVTGASTAQGSGFFYVNRVGNASEKPNILGQYVCGTDCTSSSFSSQLLLSNTYTGFLLKSSSTNISGKVSIYGLAAS